MNKTEYLAALKSHLRRLPREDYQTAMDYYEEYFADAGVENEAQVIEDLGSPEFAADQVITTLALNNAKEPVTDVKKGLGAVWVGILALCAAPIALPLVLVLIVTILLIFFCVLLSIFSIVLAGALLTVFGPVCMIGSFSLITTSVPVFIGVMGWGFSCLGIGLLVTFGSIWLCKIFLTGMVRFFGRMVKKGGQKNEQK